MLPPGALALMQQRNLAWNRKVRLMRRDATLGFLRDMYMAPILTADWTVKADEGYESAEQDITESFIPLRFQFLRDALRGLLDFGWQPYEMVKAQRDDGTFKVVKLKGLLQDLSTLLVDYHGELVGVRNYAIYNLVNPNPVYCLRGDVVVLYRDAEGTNWYSEPLMRRCERPYDRHVECDDAARRFDNKLAGSHWVIKYPEGTSEFNGVPSMDNGEIARTIMSQLSSSGMVAIPSTVKRQLEDLNQVGQDSLGWSIELISAQTQQSAFVDGLKYQDSLKCRGIGIPERSVTEGQFGTKAEAEAHADFAIDNLEMTHREILRLLNQQAVNVILELNHGPQFRDHVRVEAMVLSDAKRAFLKQLYDKHWGNEGGQAEENDAVDWDNIRELFEIPVRHRTRDPEDRGDFLPDDQQLQYQAAPSLRRGMRELHGPVVQPGAQAPRNGQPSNGEARPSREQRFDVMRRDNGNARRLNNGPEAV
jgi:hypothetical protein